VTSDDINHDHEDDESVITGSGGSISYDGSAPTPNTSLGGVPATPPRTSSPLPMMGSLIRPEVIKETAEDANLPPAKNSISPTTSPAHAPHRPSHQARTPSLALALGQQRPESGSTSSLLGPGASGLDRRLKPRGYSSSTLMNYHYPSALSLQSNTSSQVSTKPAYAPFLLRTLPKAPPNPRDHSLLEGIYNEMNAARFINLAPLSLLANMVGLHFKGFFLLDFDFE
jgi:hypothetical protein